MLVLASLVIFASITAFARRDATAAEPGLRLADVLESPVFYGEIPDGKAFFAAFDKHPWVRMMQSDAMADLRIETLDKMASTLLDGFPESIDGASQIRSVFSILDGDLEFAVSPGEEALVHVVAKAGLGSGANALFEPLSEMLRESDGATVVEEHGCEIIRLDVGDPSIGAIDVFVAHGSLVIGNDRATMKRLITNTTATDGFATEPSVLAMRSAAEQQRSHVNYWIDLEEYMDLSMALGEAEDGPDAEPVRALFEWFGVEGQFIGSIRYDPSGPVEYASFHDLPESGPVSRVMAAMQPGLTMQRRASSSAALWVGMRLDVGLATDLLAEGIGALAEAHGVDAEEKLAAFRDRDSNPYGISLTEDLIATLGDEMSIEMIPPTAGPIPQVVARMTVRDPATLRATLGRLVEALSDSGEDAPVRIATRDLSGTTMYVFTFGDAPVRPALAVTDEEVVVSLFATRMREALAETKAPLAEHSAFQAAAGRLGIEADAMTTASFIDWFALARYGKNAADGILDMLGESGGPDLTLLPDIADLREFLGPTLAVQTKRDGRVHYASTGPVGTMAWMSSLLAASRRVIEAAADHAER